MEYFPISDTLIKKEAFLLFLCTLIESEAFFLLNSSMQVDGVCAVLSPDKNLSYEFFFLKCMIIFSKNIATMPDVSCLLYQRLYVNGTNSSIKYLVKKHLLKSKCLSRSEIEPNIFDENMYIYVLCKVYLIFKLRYVATLAYESQDRNNAHLYVMFLHITSFDLTL